MIGESDDAPGRENFAARVFDGLSGALVNDMEDLWKTSARSLGGRPAG